MSKSIKLKNNIYLDSSSIKQNRGNNTRLMLNSLLNLSPLANVKSSSISSYKDITEAGIYNASSELTDTPSNYGFLIVMNRGVNASYRCYFFISNTCRLWISIYWNGTWYDWVEK